MATITEKISRLKKELDTAMQDEKYKNLSSVSGDSLTKSGRDYLRRHNDRIGRLSHELNLHLRIRRIIEGEVFTLDDIDRCRMEIMNRFPQYEHPIDADSGILLAAEAIRKSFGKSSL